MAWWDTLISGANTLGNLYNTAKPLINTGAAIYDRNQTRGAISDAFNAYKGYADQSLNTLGQVYNQGVQATQPYRQAGTSALSGYQNLLQNPSQITNDPGYQFRLKQGEQAVTRNAAANRMLGSGNFAAALQDYGQGMASSELDRSLSRYLPMVQAGQGGVGQMMDAGRSYAYGVAGINEALGESAGGARIGQAGATSDMLKDILGLGGGSNPFSAIGNVGGQIRDLMTGDGPLSNAAKSIGNYLGGNAAANAGALNGLGAVGGTVAGLGSIGGAGIGTGAAALGGGGFGAGLGSAGLGGVGIGGAGAGTLPGMGGSAAAFNSMTSGIGSGVGSGTAATAGSIGALGALGIAASVIAIPKLLSSLSGGASDRNKVNEVAAWFQKSPEAGFQNLDNIINNVKWSNELSNIGVISGMVDAGVINVAYPTLHSANSIIDVWNNAPGNTGKMGALWKRYGSQNTELISPKVEAQTYGLNEAQQNQYASASRALQESARSITKDPDNGYLMYVDDPGSDQPGWGRAETIFDMPQGSYVMYSPDGDNSRFTRVDQLPGYAQVQAIRSQYMTEDRKRATAQKTYQQLRNAGYTGDLSKLEAYLRAA